MALTSGLWASFWRLTRKYVSLVASSAEKIRTSVPERNHASHSADGTNATPMPRSAARTTAYIVSSSITFLGSGVSRPSSSAQLVQANGRVLCTINAISRKTSLPRRATVGACSFEQTAVSDRENSLEVFSPCGTWSDSRMETSAVAGWIDGRGSRVSICMSISGCSAQKLVRRGMNNSLAKNGGNNTRRVCLPLRRAICAKLRSSASSKGSTSSSNVCPAVVSSSARVLRSNSRTPSESSSSFIWWLTADGVRKSSSAANLKLRCRAAAQNVLRFLSGGGRDKRIKGGATRVSSIITRGCKFHADDRLEKLACGRF